MATQQPTTPVFLTRVRYYYDFETDKMVVDTDLMIDEFREQLVKFNAIKKGDYLYVSEDASSILDDLLD